MSKPNIKILVSCHKPVCIPCSDLYLPVHVGSLGKETIPGCQRDDCGENISDRNFTFCEMSGQYWAWKNLEADYVGQCHYRRFFNFDEKKYESNDHAQIEDDCLSPLSIKKYQLANESLIRDCVEKVDLVRAPYWDVRGVPTPCGPKKTIRDHMCAYGLVTQAELDHMVDICKIAQPDYVDELVAYLNGSKYLGYNCFVMKKTLFDELCAFEFSILQQFDFEYDYENKTTTHKRICGYLGEILYSVFVSHISKRGIKIAERPLVFFEETPAPIDAAVVDSQTVDIVWRYAESTPIKFSVALESLIRQLDATRKYRLLLIHNCQFNFANCLNILEAIPENLEIRQATFPVVGPNDLFGSMDAAEAHIVLPFMLPRIMDADSTSHHRVLWVEGCAFFKKDPAVIIEGSVYSLAAIKSVFLEKELNKPVSSRLRDLYLAAAGGWEMSEASALIVDLSQLSTICPEPYELYCACASELGIDPRGDLAKEFQKYQSHKKKPGSAKDAFCFPLSVFAVRSLMMRKLNFSFIPNSSSMPVVSFEEVGMWANECTAKEYKASDESGLLLYSSDTTPFSEPANALCRDYWRLARCMDAYESLLVMLAEYRPLGLKRTLFPVGTRRHRVMFKMVSLIRRFR